MYYKYLGIYPYQGSSLHKFGYNNEVASTVKLLSLAICSLGIWVLLNPLLGPASIWEDIVFGAIAAILALMAAFKK